MNILSATVRRTSVNFQIGQFATVVGNWVRGMIPGKIRSSMRRLPYENLTGIWDSEAPEDADDLLYWAHVGELRQRRLLRQISSPSHHLGPELCQRLRGLRLSRQIRLCRGNEKRVPRLATRILELTQVGFEHPTFSGRVGFRPNEMWNLGFSASAGPYLLPVAAPTLRPAAASATIAKSSWRRTVLRLASLSIVGGIL